MQQGRRGQFLPHVKDYNVCPWGRDSLQGDTRNVDYEGSFASHQRDVFGDSGV